VEVDIRDSASHSGYKKYRVFGIAPQFLSDYAEHEIALVISNLGLPRLEGAIIEGSMGHSLCYIEMLCTEALPSGIPIEKGIPACLPITHGAHRGF
jgi:hypothetical protein